MTALPIIDLDLFHDDPASDAAKAECVKVRESFSFMNHNSLHQIHQAAEALITYGALVVKDSRVTEADNEKFLDLLEGTCSIDIRSLFVAARLQRSVFVGVYWPGTDTRST